MTLLFDLGNTRLKGARLERGEIADAIALAHAEPEFEPRLRAWLVAEGAGAGTTAWLAAVAPEPVPAQVQRILAEHGVACRRVGTQAEALGLRIAYADPSQFGVDRWLALLGSGSMQRDACLVASVGTALTLDAVDAGGRHLGGLIAPAPDTMRAALLTRAPRLTLAPGAITEFAASTPDAISSGCMLAAVALIERSLSVLALRLGTQPRLLVTGGGAPPLRAWLPPHEHDAALVLRGLACWAAAQDPAVASSG